MWHFESEAICNRMHAGTRATMLGILYTFPLDLSLGGLAQSVECDVRNVEAEGSKPSFSSFWFSWKMNSRLQSKACITSKSAGENTDGGLAQLVECVVSNDEAPGSKPGFSTFSFSQYSGKCVDCAVSHLVNFVRGISSIGRVRALQARGTGIETPILHNFCFVQRCYTHISELRNWGAAGVVVTYQVPNLVPRVRFPGGAVLVCFLPWVYIFFAPIRGEHNQMYSPSWRNG